ncbi:MAG: hypothetical protein JST92_02080 [Deltaproteobacteria bacterium]|nr:hypothetical protein [Deltaproteobacteria bacterium]
MTLRARVLTAFVLSLAVACGESAPEKQRTSMDSIDWDAIDENDNGSQPEAEELIDVGALPIQDLRSSFGFHIPSGKHRSKGGGPGTLHFGTHPDRTVHFRAKFHQNAAYTTASSGNQSDWNKLLGITTNWIHKNSIRLGWAYNPSTKLIDLGFYGYIHKTRYMPKITSVPLETWVDCELHLWREGMSVTVNGQTTTINQDLHLSTWFPTMTWVLMTAYFGGDETAPHDIDVDVTDVREL